MDRLLPLRAVCRLLAVPAADIRAWVDAGTFPPPVALPDGRRRWRASSVTAWMATLGFSPTTEEAQEQMDRESLPSLAREILQVLEEAGQGKWVGTADIAARIDETVDRSAGSWKRSTRILREFNLIETQKGRGMRLGPAWKPEGVSMVPGEGS